jgi:ribonuclease HI
MEETLTLEFDGGARGNPGPAGIGVVIRAKDGTPLVTIGRPIGHATNNVAEYKALILALEKAKGLGARKICVRGDSELIVKQMRGEYKVKNADLRDLWEEAQHLYHQFDEARIDHNLRDKNKLADKLANLAMDRKAEVTDADEAPIDQPAPAAPKSGDRFACPRCGCSIDIRTPSRLRPHQLRPFICQCGARMNQAP